MRSHPATHPTPEQLATVRAEIAVKAEMLDALHQYRSDMIYPPAADSRERRVAMIDKLIAKATGAA